MFVSEFEVLTFDRMISDAQCRFHFSLICNEIELKVRSVGISDF